MKKLLPAMAFAAGLTIRGAPVTCAGTAAHPLLTCDWNPDGALGFNLTMASTGPVALGGFNYIPQLSANPSVAPSGYWKIDFTTFSEVSAAIPVGAKVAVQGKLWHTFAPGAPAGHAGDVILGTPLEFKLGIEANGVAARDKMLDSTDFQWVQHPDHWDRMRVSLAGSKPAGNDFGIKSFELKFEAIHLESSPEPGTAALTGAALILAGLIRRVKIEDHAKAIRRPLDLLARVRGSHFRPRH